MKSVDAAAIYDGPAIGLLFIDGWHSTEAVEEDVHSWLPYLAPQRTIVFDDWERPEVGQGIKTSAHWFPPWSVRSARI